MSSVYNGWNWIPEKCEAKGERYQRDASRRGAFVFPRELSLSLCLFLRAVNNISGQTLSIAVKIVKVLRSHPPVRLRACTRVTSRRTRTTPAYPHAWSIVYFWLACTRSRALVDVRRSTFLHFLPAIPLQPPCARHPSRWLPSKFSVSSLFAGIGSPSVGFFSGRPVVSRRPFLFPFKLGKLFRGEQTGLNW